MIFFVAQHLLIYKLLIIFIHKLQGWNLKLVSYCITKELSGYRMIENGVQIGSSRSNNDLFRAQMFGLGKKKNITFCIVNFVSSPNGFV